MKLSIKITSLAGVIAAVFSSMIGAQTANAGSHAKCIGYGQTSVRQQASNVRNRCGFGGARWHYNEGAHYTWCRIASGNTRRFEVNKRARALRRCVGGNAGQNNGGNAGGNNAGAKHNACIAYARGAVNQHRKNVRSQCGYRGTRWQYSFRAHKNWCMGVSRRARVAEINARGNAIRSCVRGNGQNAGQNAGGARVRACNGYAQQAVNQYRRSRNMVCGFRGSRWQPSFRAHKNWCLTASRAARSSETRARRRALNACSP